MRRAGPPPRAVRARGRRPAVSAGGACVEGGAGQGVGVGGAGRAELRARGMRCPPRLQADAPSTHPTHPTHPPTPPTHPTHPHAATTCTARATLAALPGCGGRTCTTLPRCVGGGGGGCVRACVRACFCGWASVRLLGPGAHSPAHAQFMFQPTHHPPTHSFTHPPTPPPCLCLPPGGAPSRDWQLL